MPWATPERNEPGRDEGEERRHGEERHEPRVVVVIAREDERDRDRCLDDRCRRREREFEWPHAISAATASPVNSAFGMNPLAPLDAISGP